MTSSNNTTSTTTTTATNENIPPPTAATSPPQLTITPIHKQLAHLQINYGETSSSTSSLSTSSTSTSSQQQLQINQPQPRESIDLKYMPINKQKGMPSSSSNAEQQQEESTEEKTCLEMYMDSPCSGIWMYEAGDRLDKIHPLLSIPLYIICCPFAMPCIFLSGCMMASDGSCEDDPEDTTVYEARMRNMKEAEKMKQEGKIE